MIVNLMNQPTMSQQHCGKFIFWNNNRKKGHQSDKRKGLCTSCRTVPRVRPKLDNFFGVFPPEPRFSILSWLSFMETLLVARNLGEDLFNNAWFLITSQLISLHFPNQSYIFFRTLDSRREKKCPLPYSLKSLRFIGWFLSWRDTWIRHSLAATCCLEGVPCPHAAAINKPPLPDHSFVNFAFNRHISTDKNRTKTKEGRSYACEPEKKQEQGKESDLVATIAGGANRV
jgi:hypothetical protein